MPKGELEEVYSTTGTVPPRLSPSSRASPPEAAPDNLKVFIRDRVLTVLRTGLKLKVDQIDFDTPLTSLGIDSVGMVTIALDLEEKTGKKVSGDTLYENQTINELAAYLINAAPQHKKTSEAITTAASDEEESKPSPIVLIGRTDRYRQATRRFDKWQEEDKYFFHTPFSEQSDAWVVSGDKQMLMLGSYSYLGLLRHPAVIEASCQAT